LRRHHDLILRVRENLEAQTEAAGRAAQAVWAEVMQTGDEAADRDA